MESIEIDLEKKTISISDNTNQINYYKENTIDSNLHLKLDSI